MHQIGPSYDGNFQGSLASYQPWCCSIAPRDLDLLQRGQLFTTGSGAGLLPEGMLDLRKCTRLPHRFFCVNSQGDLDGGIASPRDGMGATPPVFSQIEGTLTVVPHPNPVTGFASSPLACPLVNRLPSGYLIHADNYDVS